LRALYGTTCCGGPSGAGTAFKLAPPGAGQTAWTEAELGRFTAAGDGGLLYAGLFSPTAKISPSTALYGTTTLGGGTVFRLTGRTVTTLWTFTGGQDGDDPFGSGVIAGQGGALYGTTQLGAASNCGAVYRLTPPGADQTAWTETTLWAFTRGGDGCYPYGLIADASGALYGTTNEGGSASCAFGCGTVFELIPPAPGQTEWTEQTLHSFVGGGDGAYPVGVLAAGRKGALYGTTSAGGAGPCTFQHFGQPGCGTVFELTPPGDGRTAWTKQTVWSFSGGGGGAFYDVDYQLGGALLIDSGGALYGTTPVGGSNSVTGPCQYDGGLGCGTVFKLTPPKGDQTAWTETTLWAFTGGSDGGPSVAGLVADTAGALYGTTNSGGDLNCGYFGAGCGVVFRLTGTGYAP
jgi:uncharacterized repeat protein (TIGR03803 family)